MKRRKILYPVNFSQAATEPPAGGAPAGQQQGGVAPHSAVGQAQAAATAAPAAGSTGDKPAGYVPVGELAQERAKRHELEQRVAAAEQASKDQIENFKKALGLSEGQTPEQLKAAAEAAKTTATAAQSQLAVFKLAKDAGGDAHALLDSASFLQSLSKIDANDPAALTAAIKAAVESNKNLAYRKVAPGGAHDASQGAGGGSTAPTMNELIRAGAGKA